METVNRSNKPKNFIFLIFFLVGLSFGPCLPQATATGIYHVVKKQETLFSIARAYKISVQDLASVNRIEDINAIKEGTVLYIPHATEVIDHIPPPEKNTVSETKSSPSENPTGVISDFPKKNKQDVKGIAGESGPAPEQRDRLPQKSFQEPPADKRLQQDKESSVRGVGREEKEFRSEASAPQALSTKTFLWPVRGVVATGFGKQPNKTFHNWIKIIIQDKAKVKAAAAGQVIFSSYLKNYGETIILRHKNNYATVYTHLQKRMVRIDQTVKKGEVIALAGKKDEEGHPFIHFEIRLKGKAVDPLLYLP